MTANALPTADPLRRASYRRVFRRAPWIVLLLVATSATSAMAQPAGSHHPAPAQWFLQLSGWEPESRLQSNGLSEISGITQSRKHAGVFWVHGDSGTPARLYAVRADGTVVTRMEINGAANFDWEDVTSDDEGNLFIGDIGDNMGRRPQLRIYHVAEPESLEQQVVRSPAVKALAVQLPDGRENCEALFWWQGDLHLIAKEHSRKSPLYRLEPAGEGLLNAKAVGKLGVAPITGAEVSADGKRLVICGYGQIAVFALGDSLDGIAHAGFQHKRIPPWFQIEACCFDGEDVIVTAEDGNLWRVAPDEFTAHEAQ